MVATRELALIDAVLSAVVNKLPVETLVEVRDDILAPVWTSKLLVVTDEALLILEEKRELAVKLVETTLLMVELIEIKLPFVMLEREERGLRIAPEEMFPAIMFCTDASVKTAMGEFKFDKTDVPVIVMLLTVALPSITTLLRKVALSEILSVPLIIAPPVTLIALDAVDVIRRGMGTLRFASIVTDEDITGLAPFPITTAFGINVLLPVPP